MPWTDLDGHSVVLADLLTPTVQYERDGADLSRRGLYLDLPAVGTRRRRSRLLDVGLGDLADERSPRHVESAVNGAGQRTGVVLEDLVEFMEQRPQLGIGWNSGAVDKLVPRLGGSLEPRPKRAREYPLRDKAIDNPHRGT